MASHRLFDARHRRVKGFKGHWYNVIGPTGEMHTVYCGPMHTLLAPGSLSPAFVARVCPRVNVVNQGSMLAEMLAEAIDPLFVAPTLGVNFVESWKLILVKRVDR